MNPNALLLYRILYGAGIGVQINAADKDVWRLTGIPIPERPVEKLNAADLMMIVKCCLQIWVQLTSDPFVDLTVLECQADGFDQDAMIIRVQS